MVVHMILDRHFTSAAFRRNPGVTLGRTVFRAQPVGAVLRATAVVLVVRIAGGHQLLQATRSTNEA